MKSHVMNPSWEPVSFGGPIAFSLFVFFYFRISRVETGPAEKKRAEGRGGTTGYALNSQNPALWPPIGDPVACECVNPERFKWTKIFLVFLHRPAEATLTTQ